MTDTFLLPTDTRSPEELLMAGEYDSVTPETKDFVLGEEFSTEDDSAEVIIELVEFDRRMIVSEVFAEIRQRGLLRPTARDCLRFGATPPHAQRPPLVFLHKPWHIGFGILRVMILGNLFGRERRLYTGEPIGRWPEHYRFPARRPSI